MNYKENISSYGRFKGATWFNKISTSKMFVGGAGGIGSWLSFMLARTGAVVTTVDGDMVGIENLAGQLYGHIHIGKPKIEALDLLISSLCEEPTYRGINKFIDEKDISWHKWIKSADVVAVGFDSLSARRLVYDAWKKVGKEQSLFIDGRLNFEEGQIFVVDKEAQEWVYEAYEGTYFDPSEVDPIPCTMKATTHCGSLIASLMTSQIVNWCFNQTNPVMKRDVKNLRFTLPIDQFNTLNYSRHATLVE